VADFESLARRRYWDLEPLLERHWKAFERRLWEEQSDTEREEYQAAFAKVRAVHRRLEKCQALTLEEFRSDFTVQLAVESGKSVERSLVVAHIEHGRI